MARDYSIGQRLLSAACGIAIVAVSVIVEKRQLISDRGKEAFLWLLTLPLAAALVFLARILTQMWHRPKLDDDALSMPARSDRWIAAQAKVLARRQKPSVVSGVTFVLYAIVCLLVSIVFLWMVLGALKKPGSVGAGDVIGILVAAIFLVMLLLGVALWRALRASERHLARVVMQRSSKAISPGP